MVHPPMIVVGCVHGCCQSCTLTPEGTLLWPLAPIQHPLDVAEWI
jgi:hypothetical protein